MTDVGFETVFTDKYNGNSSALTRKMLNIDVVTLAVGDKNDVASRRV